MLKCEAILGIYFSLVEIGQLGASPPPRRLCVFECATQIICFASDEKHIRVVCWGKGGEFFCNTHVLIPLYFSSAASNYDI